jgi:cell division protein FtsX
VLTLAAVVGAVRLAFAGWLRQQEAAAAGLRIVGPGDVWPLSPALFAVGVAGAVIAAFLAARRVRG